MPEPVFSDVHIQAALTNISVAYLQDESDYIADKVFPVVPVTHQADKFYKYSKDDYFRDEAQPRADATESAGTGFNLSQGSYSAITWAIHQDIGDQARRNADPAIDLDVAATRLCMQKMLIRRDKYFVTTFMATGVWNYNIVGAATGNTTVPDTTTNANRVYWNDDSNSDPFSDVSELDMLIQENTGRKPNTLVLGPHVYATLRKHPLVIDRIKYTSQAFSGNITPDLMAAAFDVERVLIPRGIQNTAAQGATGVFSFLTGKSALLCHSARAPGLWTPSAGYTFSWSGLTGLNNLGVRIMQIPMPLKGVSTVRTEAEMAFDMKVVGADLGAFASSIIS